MGLAFQRAEGTTGVYVISCTAGQVLSARRRSDLPRARVQSTRVAARPTTVVTQPGLRFNGGREWAQPLSERLQVLSDKKREGRSNEDQKQGWGLHARAKTPNRGNFWGRLGERTN